MRVVYKVPGKKPEVRDIENNYKVLQEMVGGYVEHVELRANKLGLIINEEGKLNRMEPNFYMPRFQDVIVGPAIFVGEQGDEFTDLADEDIAIVMALFSEGVL